MSAPALRARPERFGAMVALDSPPALMAVDRALARRVGVEGGTLWEGPSPGLDVDPLMGPTEVHLAVTARCPAACKGCYADATPQGEHPTFDALARRLRAIAERGAFSVAFGGGEALVRDDLPELVALARSLGVVPTMTTSGIGLTAARARTLRGFAQVNVSYDGVGATYEAVRGYDGASRAERAMALLREAGVSFGVNVVLTRASFERIDETADRAAELGARELQLLRFKPSGRGRLDYLAARLDEAQVARFPAVLRRLSERLPVALRVDCALVPFLAGSVSAEDLVRFGVMGCEGGRSLLAVKATGASAPCSFWGDEGRPAEVAWEEDEAVHAFRAYRAALPEPCDTCEARLACRGGCRIVAGHLTGEPFAPDPECPRVRAHRGHTTVASARPHRHGGDTEVAP